MSCNTSNKSSETKTVKLPVDHQKELPKKVIESQSSTLDQHEAELKSKTVSELTEVDNSTSVSTLKKSVNKLVETPDKLQKVVTKKTTETLKKIAQETKDAVPSKQDLELTETPITEVKVNKVITEKAIEPEKNIERVIIRKPTHEIWDNLTKNHVSKDGKVNYTAFKKNLATLETYLKLLEETPPNKEWSKTEKLAYWFNLYNASTVHLVATNYPVKSIKNINGGKPWDKKFIASGSAIYSLNDIENTIVRPNYNEPRLHVAFNCAAVSCPNLLNEAFEASKLNIQLDKLAKQWISDSSKNELTNSEKINISQIFNWYAVDFKNGVIPFINKYTNNPINENASIDYLEYNWDLND